MIVCKCILSVHTYFVYNSMNATIYFTQINESIIRSRKWQFCRLKRKEIQLLEILLCKYQQKKLSKKFSNFHFSFLHNANSWIKGISYSGPLPSFEIKQFVIFFFFLILCTTIDSFIGVVSDGLNHQFVLFFLSLIFVHFPLRFFLGGRCMCLCGKHTLGIQIKWYAICMCVSYYMVYNYKICSLNCKRTTYILWFARNCVCLCFVAIIMFYVWSIVYVNVLYGRN